MITVAAAIFFIFRFAQVMDEVPATMSGALRGQSDNGFPALESLGGMRDCAGSGGADPCLALSSADGSG